MNPATSGGYREWYVTSKKFTVWVKTRVDKKETIIDTAPVVKKFIGQSFSALTNWMRADSWSLIKNTDGGK